MEITLATPSATARALRVNHAAVAPRIIHRLNAFHERYRFLGPFYYRYPNLCRAISY
jgi:hypothetical protein